ncbi:hypothetical protein VNO77_04241 [Canavalia gladiata]|uniref:SIN3 transcription regulator family member B n=1 Tax=Canavalia gladiata TaxID=3824 RepID=A0AAN9N2P1_CANGL
MSSEGGKGQSKIHALAYLKAVKNAFKDKREKYNYFLEFMKDYEDRRIDTERVVAKVMELFKEHTDLMLGFNTFLPAEYRIKFPVKVEFPPKRVRGGSGNAIKFVKKVKARFRCNQPAYRYFISTMLMLEAGKMYINEAYHQIMIIFEGHADLLHDFLSFFPRNSVAAASA